MGCVGAIAEEMVFHLAGQVLAGTQIGQVQAVFIHQHGLVLEPVGPGLLAHTLPDALAQFSGVGRKIQTLSFFAEFDALNGACYVGVLPWCILRSAGYTDIEFPYFQL